MLYEERLASSRWRPPAEFNFAWDVIDAFAEDRSRTAVYCETADGRRKERWTFWDVRERSRRLANGLRTLGVERGQSVAIAVPATFDWVTAIVAVLRIGGVALLRSSEPEIDALEPPVASNAPTVIAPEGGPGSDLVVVTAPPRNGRVRLRDLIEMSSPAMAPVSTKTADAAIAFLTSGTDGRPKVIVHAHAWTLAQRIVADCWLDLRPSDLVCAPFESSSAEAASASLFAPWCVGAPVLLADRPEDARALIGCLERNAVRVFAATPWQYRRLLEEGLDVHRLEGLRHCTSAGESLPPAVFHAWKDAVGVPIHEAFTTTEAGLPVGNVIGLPLRAGSIGKPLPGYDVRLVDAHGADVRAGASGEIVISRAAPSLFLVGASAEGPVPLLGDFHRTGDLATRDPQGYFWFAGRSLDAAGPRTDVIAPADVERLLSNHPDVRDVAVVARSVSPGLTAFVALRPSVAQSGSLADELRERIASRSASESCTVTLEFLDQLPRNRRGKVRRHELRVRAMRMIAS